MHTVPPRTLQHSLLYLSCLLVLGLSIQTKAFSLSPPSDRSNTLLDRSIVFQEDFDPPGEDAPPNSRGAGSRDGLRCSVDRQPLQVLMPERNFALTLAERPKIFLDLSNTSAQRIVLTFRDQAGVIHDRAILPITEHSESAYFQLPDTTKALEVGKNYQWSAVIVCGDSVQPDDPVVRGWVQRVEKTPAIVTALAEKSALEQAQWYADRGYWYDLLTVLKQADYCCTEIWQALITNYVASMPQ